MEQNNSVIITYKYYDDKKRRVAIMARKIPLRHTEITIITCSRKDAFCKNKVRRALEQYHEPLKMGQSPRAIINGEEAHPKTVIINNNGKFKDTFFEWANDNYYKMREGTVVYHTLEAVRGNTSLILREDKYVQKMDKRYF